MRLSRLRPVSGVNYIAPPPGRRESISRPTSFSSVQFIVAHNKKHQQKWDKKNLSLCARPTRRTHGAHPDAPTEGGFAHQKLDPGHAPAPVRQDICKEQRCPYVPPLSKRNGLAARTHVFFSGVLFVWPGRCSTRFTHPPIHLLATYSWAQTEISLGPCLSGAQVHSHTAAFNVLVRGRKRWFLFPPTQSYWGSNPKLHTTGMPVLQWVLEELTSSVPLGRSRLSSSKSLARWSLSRPTGATP